MGIGSAYVPRKGSRSKNFALLADCVSVPETSPKTAIKTQAKPKTAGGYTLERQRKGAAKVYGRQCITLALLRLKNLAILVVYLVGLIER
jgi:hypothetical protein